MQRELVNELRERIYHKHFNTFYAEKPPSLIDAYVVPHNIKDWFNKDLKSTFANDFHICPPNSNRSPGRQGLFLNHVIEFGAFYHRLVPLASVSSWNQKIINSETFVVRAEVDAHLKGLSL